MQNKISKSYCPASQKFFQDLPLRSFLHLSSVLSSWVKKPIPPRWSNLLAFHFFTALYPASPDSLDKTSGRWKRWPRPRWNNSSTPCGSKPIPCSSLSWMTRSSTKVVKRFQDVPGIEIMLRRLMSWAINGSFLLCSIRTSFCPSP